ncbi:MAG: hypothetical protein NTV87_18060 [Ignavibacteriae bacterium]|nr:hypothetical protein [Ignavibacteriota bacterium]
MEKHPVEFSTSIFRIILLIIALIIISAIASSSLGLKPLYSVIFTFVYLLVFITGMFFSAMLFSIHNSSVRKAYGFSVIIKTIINGFAFLFPFAVLAVFSDFIFKWNAIQPVASAAIFTCVSVSASDLMKSGGKRAGNLIFSFAVSLIFLFMFFVCGMLAVAFLK